MNIQTSISSSDVGRAPHALISAPEPGVDCHAPSGYASSSPAQRRASLALAVVCHAAFFGAALYELTKADTFEPPVQGTQISYFDLGAQPPAGDPEGDDAPLKAQPEMPEEVEVETPTPDQAESDEELVEESPIPDEDKAPAEAAAEAAAEEAPEAPRFAAGTGTLALGAKVRGDVGSVDGDLAAAIGVSVATRIRTCWDAPTTGVPDTLAITMSATFDESGALVGTPQISRLVDETYMVVTEPDAYEQAAINAVERCSPLQLPPHLFSYWREVDIEIFSARTAEPETAEMSEQNPTLRS
ncbi:hypothetical protein [Erythrobacter aureus]|uniref:hypothetical protein n=1 Tax=Erythrobacter aureus TaxID=2182384 RepID=UPI0013B3F446|nr:hypothetical protein [Erythrobacter aureus]